MTVFKTTLIALLILAGLSSLPASAQQKEEAQAIKSAIDRLFEGMKEKDPTMIESVFADGAILQTIKEKDGDLVVQTDQLSAFIQSIAAIPAEVSIEERLLDYDINVDGPLAAVWTPYQFYVNGKPAHCGANSFQLVKRADGWKIIYLVDTRRKEGC